MASVTKRGKTWQYTVSRYTNGKFDPVRKGGFSTKKEAQVAAMTVEMHLQKGGNVLTRDKAFTDFFEVWVEKFKSGKHVNTYRRYKDSLNRSKEFFKDKPIQKISSEEYQIFLDDYAKSHAKESVRKLNTHIRACVKDAIDEGYIAIDFTRKAQIGGAVPAKKASEKHIGYDDSKKLYNYLLNNASATSHYLILLGLVSGLRFGELVGLTKDAIDFENNQIYIYQAWDYRNGNGFTDLKNTASERTIPIEKRVMSILKDFIVSEKEVDNGLVFHSVGNLKVVSNNAANKTLKNILTKLGIKEITCHGLRHTHASVLLYEGINVQYVSERLGHDSIQTTMQTYAHVLRELRAREEEKALMVYEKMIEEKVV